MRVSKQFEVEGDDVGVTWDIKIGQDFGAKTCGMLLGGSPPKSSGCVELLAIDQTKQTIHRCIWLFICRRDETVLNLLKAGF